MANDTMACRNVSGCTGDSQMNEVWREDKRELQIGFGGNLEGK